MYKFYKVCYFYVNKYSILLCDRGTKLITKEILMDKYNITEELIQSSEMEWTEFCDIYEDFSKNKYEHYKEIMEDFLATYLKDINEKNGIEKDREVKIHSIRSRVKDAEHLIVKIIRKKQENDLKYRNLDKNNYEKFITDLIGIRCLVLFKDDWENLHYYLLSKFENNVEYYVKDAVSDFDDNINHYYFAEKPKVHIRNGDARDGYEKVLSPDCVLDGKVYRSIHYIIKYKGVYLEIQVRTIFEEGWGEVDHTIVYPYYQDDRILKEYTELLNRLSGLADEMSAFFVRLKKLEVKNIEKETPTINIVQSEAIQAEDRKRITPNKELTNEKAKFDDNTPLDCLRSVLDE